MRNFSDATLKKKGEQIKARYIPLKFLEPGMGSSVIRKRTTKTKMREIFRILWNERYENATSDIRGEGGYTPNGRGRSYYDAYRLCMNYCPEVSFIDMWDELCKVINRSHRQFELDLIDRYGEEEAYGAVNKRAFWTCPDIGRARFCNEYKLITR